MIQKDYLYSENQLNWNTIWRIDNFPLNKAKFIYEVQNDVISIWMVCYRININKSNLKKTIFICMPLFRFTKSFRSDHHQENFVPTQNNSKQSIVLNHCWLKLGQFIQSLLLAGTLWSSSILWNSPWKWNVNEQTSCVTKGKLLC